MNRTHEESTLEEAQRVWHQAAALANQANQLAFEAWEAVKAAREAARKAELLAVWEAEQHSR